MLSRKTLLIVILISVALIATIWIVANPNQPIVAGSTITPVDGSNMASQPIVNTSTNSADQTPAVVLPVTTQDKIAIPSTINSSVVPPVPETPIPVPVVPAVVPAVPAPIVVVPPVDDPILVPDAPVVPVEPVVNITVPAQTVWYWNGTDPVPDYCLEWQGPGFPPPSYELIAANGSTVFDVVPWNGTLDLTLDGTNLTADMSYDLFNGLVSTQDIYGTIHAGESLHWTFNSTSILRSYDNTWGWRPCYDIYVLVWTDSSPTFPVTAFALAFPGETTHVTLNVNVPAPAQTVWYWNDTSPLPDYCLEWQGPGFPPPSYELIAANGSTVFDVVPWNGTLEVTIDGTNLTANTTYTMSIEFSQQSSGSINVGEISYETSSAPTILNCYDAVWGWRPAYTVVVNYGTSSIVTAFALASPGETTYVHLDL